MWSHIFLLLAICHGFVSAAKVEVHVTGATGYKKLEFRGLEKTKVQVFTLGDKTEGTTVKLDNGKIDEEKLTVDFAPTFAAIWPVCAHPKTYLKEEKQGTCTSNCFKKVTDTYSLHVSGIHETQTEMTCKEKKDGTGKTKEFTLKHGGAAGTAANQKGEISVKDGAFTETLLKFDFTPAECEIPIPKSRDQSKTRNSLQKTAAAVITIEPTTACTSGQNCFKVNGAIVEVHASGVAESQENIKFVKEADEKIFTLVEGGTTSGNIIAVRGGVINELEVPLTFEPSECTIEAGAGKDWIPLVQSATCSATTGNCFKNEDSTTTSFAASNKFSKMILPVVYLIIGKMW